MDKVFQNFLNLVVVGGTLCLFSRAANASSQSVEYGVYGRNENCEAPHTIKTPANAYGDLPRGYQYLDVPGRGRCGYWAVLLGLKVAKNPNASSIELAGRDVTDQLGKFGAHVARLRERSPLPLKVREAFEELAWDVACSVQKDAFDLTEGDWRGFFDALAGGGIPLDSGLIQFLAWWLGCDIIVMYGDGQEHAYSGIFLEEGTEGKAIYEDKQCPEVKEASTTSEENSQSSKKESDAAKHSEDVKISEISKISRPNKNFEVSDSSDGPEKFRKDKGPKSSETSDFSESSEEESEKESDVSDDSEEETELENSKYTIRVFYKRSEDRGHYWSVIPEQFQLRETEEDPIGMARISLYRR
ncbi:MAG: hypothetical protein LW808_003490 [Verrucomicrobiota bacterium]|nr:MAG: hypothetical protein LW808_003490 [Verrucomicrobiota bacterium]